MFSFARIALQFNTKLLASTIRKQPYAKNTRALANSAELNKKDSDAIKKIKTLITTQIKPTLQRDGGDIEFVSFENKIVRVRLVGFQSTCSSSSINPLESVRNTLESHVPQVRGVVLVMNDNLKAMSAKQNQRDMGYITIPNALTSSRILLTPVIGYFIWNAMHSYALMCFAAAAVTDLLDGFIARHFNQSSKVGAILDPIADKLLLTTCFISMNHANLMPFWLVSGFIGRDLSLMAGGAFLRYYNFAKRPPSFKDFIDFNKHPASPEFEPTFISKCNTALQCLLIVAHLSTQHDLSLLHALTATTTIVSLGQYAVRAINQTTKSK